MTYFEKLLLHYLWDGELELKITGFDMEGFQEAVKTKSKHRLEMIKSIVFVDDDYASDAEKVESIKLLFQHVFLDED